MAKWDEDEGFVKRGGLALPVDSDSDSDLDGRHGGGADDEKRRGKDIAALLRNTKNLAEPRTSQGSFGPNGQHMLLNIPRLLLT